MKEINSLKKGDFFMLRQGTPNDNNVWIYDGYNRSTRKYAGTKFGDIGQSTERKKGCKVFVNFEF